MLAFSGFNGFGQFGGEQPRKVSNFEAFTIADSSLAVEDQSKILIAPSWSYNAYASENRLLLSGFLAPTSNATRTLTTSEIIKQIAACDRFCLILLASGRLFKVAPRLDAEMQEIKFAAVSSAPAQKRSIFGVCSQPRECDTFRIAHVACGATMSVAMDTANTVYNIPSRVHQFPRHFRVRQLLCGFEHALLLSGNGDVYSWGNGLRGQLGQDVLHVEEAPELIEALAGVKITFIAAGGWHSAAVSAFGDLYTWGFNPSGQIGLRVFKSGSSAEGLKQPTVYPLPQVIDLPKCSCSEANNDDNTDADHDADERNSIVDACSPLRVFAGARHTILQMSCGAIFAAGWNAHGQLGLKDNKHDFADVFECFESFEKDFKETEIICGPWSTVLKKK